MCRPIRPRRLIAREESVGLFDQAKISQRSEADIGAVDGPVHCATRREHPRHARKALHLLDDREKFSVKGQAGTLWQEGRTRWRWLLGNSSQWRESLRKKRQRGWGVRRKREKGRKRHGGRHWERESGPRESKGCAEGAEVQHIKLPANRQKSAKSRNGTLLNRVISGGKAPSSPTSSPTTSSPMPRSNVSHLDLISNHFIFSPSLC